MKECGLCGTELSDNARFCSTCGNEFDLELAGAPWLMAPPQWGAIRFSITDKRIARELLEEIRTVWNLLEQEGQLRLFQGQGVRLSENESSVLYAPIYSFTALKKAFSHKPSLVTFSFSPITSEEFYEARESFNRS